MNNLFSAPAKHNNQVTLKRIIPAIDAYPAKTHIAVITTQLDKQFDIILDAGEDIIHRETRNLGGMIETVQDLFDLGYRLVTK